MRIMRKFEENYAVKLLELCRQTICVYFFFAISLFLEAHEEAPFRFCLKEGAEEIEESKA